MKKRKPSFKLYRKALALKNNKSTKKNNIKNVIQCCLNVIKANKLFKNLLLYTTFYLLLVYAAML